MTRIGKTTMSYVGGGRGPAQAAALSRRAMEMVSRRLPRGASGHVGRLRIEVRVGRAASDREIAERIAEAVARRF